MKTVILFILSVLFLFIVPPHSFAANDFTAEYFDNMTLSGTPVLTRSEAEVNYNWGSGSLDASIPNDRFSARWTATFHSQTEKFVFTVTADDGVRLFVDDQIVIDQWKDQPPTIYQASVDLSEGDHNLKMEYYENGGGATAKLNWQTQQPTTNEGIRIMPLGDSITDGYDIPGGYRIELENLIPNSNFVGSLQNGPGELVDKDHEGHIGWRIDQLQSDIVSWLQSSNPEMILLMIGTNDMIGNYDVANAPQRLSNLIDTISQTSPNADILVASITPLANGEMQQRANVYNDSIVGIVQQKRDAGKKVHYVDMHTVITVSDLPDGIHPSANGYTKMAQKWKSAIDTIQNGTTPEPPQNPPPLEGDGPFTVRYFNNMKVEGTPALVRYETQVNNDWGQGSPHPSVNSDFFSADWAATQVFDQGIYEFVVTADDGIRLFIDNELVIDQWKDQAPTTYTIYRELDGEVNILMQYYEKQWGAVAKLSWQKTEANQEVEENEEEPVEEEPEIEVPISYYNAEYFNNMDLAGTPVLTRVESILYNDWGSSSPHQDVQSDNFSARWTYKDNFSNSAYRFTVTADDGVRLKVDGLTVIDQWKDQAPTTYNIDLNLVAGEHTVVMEYYERAWGAVAKLSIEKVATPTPPDVTEGSFFVEYFNNSNLIGVPIHSEAKFVLNNDWGSGAPHSSVNKDYFSVRASKSANYTAGNYRFTVTADDGVRVKVDGVTVINKWIDQAPTKYMYDLVLSEGSHTVEIDYYEKEWGAVLKFNEEKLL